MWASFTNVHWHKFNFSLQCFVDELVNSLASSDFLKKQYDRVKLHATVMNTLFRVQNIDGKNVQNTDRKNVQNTDRKNVNRKERLTFDARKIFEVRIISWLIVSGCLYCLAGTIISVKR